jgi:hypothetical protein
MRGLKTLSLRIEESIHNASLINDKLRSMGLNVILVPETNMLLISHPDEIVYLKEIQ